MNGGSFTGWFGAYLVTFWLSDYFSFVSVFTVDTRTVALKSGIMCKEHLCAVALTVSARGVHAHPLASYFLVRSSTALRLLSGEYRCIVLLDYVEDIYVNDPLCPLVLIIDKKKACIPQPLAVLSIFPPAVTNVI